MKSQRNLPRFLTESDQLPTPNADSDDEKALIWGCVAESVEVTIYFYDAYPDLMYISYKKGDNGTLYATVMESKKVNGRSVKSKVDYLGVVVDREKGIYRNRGRGTFTYDVETGEYGIPDWEDVPLCERNGPPRANLDFGDVYLLRGMMRIDGLEDCIEAMGAGAEDTIAALVEFCVLTDRLGMCNAQDWYEGSYASMMHPRADLRSQRISDALMVMGDGQSHRDFFLEYIKTVTGDGDQLVAVDSKGVLNAIDIGLTETSNHNGDVSIELRLIMIVQLGTGLPLYFRVVPGNIVDAVTLLGTLEELKKLGVNTAFAAIDAGYCTLSNMDDLFGAYVNFVTRLRPNYVLYKQLVSENPDICTPDNRQIHNGRIVYIKRCEVQLTKKNRGYAYIYVDSDQRHKEEKGLVSRYERGELADSELSEALDSAGRFILVSSYMIPPEDVLDVYYTRQSAEQYFDLANGYANLTPLRVHSEEAVRGMMMLTFIASSLIRRVQIRLKGTDVPFRTAMLALRNQKCRVYDDAVFVDEPKKKAAVAYERCGIESPSKLKPTSSDRSIR